ncbi:MAG TPA: hypothetical protein VF911_00705 [Thermoanaerobaculia bacterium]
MFRRTASALVLLALASAVQAASYPPEYRWRTITTENFRIHFHSGEEELAQRAAAIAERVHTRITPLLEYEPASRTDIVLSDHIDVSNGSATPFPSNRIEVYVSAPGADPSSPLEYYDNWLNLVITHEYAHILHLDQSRGLWAGLRKMFGRVPFAFPNALSPLWITEGFATLVESEATDAGRLKGTFVDMVLRTAAVENRWPSPAQAGGLSPAWPGGSARYFFGSKFLGWVAQREGAEKIAEYFRDYAGNVIPLRVNASARAVFGESMDTLWRDWSNEQRAAYAAEVAAIGAVTERRVLTDLGYETKYPAIAPDGKTLAYVHAGPTEWPSIRLRDVASGRDTRRVQVNSDSRLSWNAAGTQLAFSQLEYHRTFSLLSDVYVLDVASGDVRRVTEGARLKDPAFTPDGGTVIAVQNRAGRNRLVEVNLTDGTVRPIVTPADFTQFSEPAVSRDGARIAVAEWRNGRVDIVLYDRTGTRIANLTESLPRSTNGSPQFSNDGAALLFSSDVTGVSNIYRVPAAGGVAERLTNLYGGAFFPSSIDDTTIYYSDYSSRGFDIAALSPARTYPIAPRTAPRSVMGAAPLVSDLTAESATGGTDLPSTPYSPLRTVLPRWWFPLLEGATSEGGGERFGIGAMTSGSDVLGFHSYDVSLLVRGGDNVRHHADYTALYSYDRWYPTLTAYAAGYSDDPTGVVFTRAGERFRYEQRTDRLVAQATVPIRRYRWQASTSFGAIRDRIQSDLPFDVSNETLATAGIFAGTLQGLRGSLFFNTAREFGYSVSPENGITALASVENLAGAFGSDASLQQYRGDLRGYRAVPFGRGATGRHVIAARVAAGRNTGDFVLQRELRVGGTGAGEFAGIETINFPVRGYSSGTLRGSDAALVSLEYRFPLYEIDRGPGNWPLFLRRIFGDVFYDTGTAWNRNAITLPAITRPRSSAFDEQNTLSSAGAELSLDLVAGFAFPIRYRLGAAYLLDGPDEGNAAVYLTFGSSF